MARSRALAAGRLRPRGSASLLALAVHFYLLWRYFYEESTVRLCDFSIDGESSFGRALDGEVVLGEFVSRCFGSGGVEVEKQHGLEDRRSWNTEVALFRMGCGNGWRVSSL